MLGFLGDFRCKLDKKGRFVLPSTFVKQLPPDEQHSMFINRGMDAGCLNLHTHTSWKEVLKQVSKLNPYNPKHRRLKRMLLSGARELTFDSYNRLLIPKIFIADYQLKGEVFLMGGLELIELWPIDMKEEVSSCDPEECSDLAAEILGNVQIEEEQEDDEISHSSSTE